MKPISLSAQIQNSKFVFTFIYIVVGVQNHWFLSAKHLLYKGDFDLDLLLILLSSSNKPTALII